MYAYCYEFPWQACYSGSRGLDKKELADATMEKAVGNADECRSNCEVFIPSLPSASHVLRFALVADPSFSDMRELCESRISRFYPTKVLHGRNTDEPLALLRSAER